MTSQNKNGNQAREEAKEIGDMLDKQLRANANNQSKCVIIGPHKLRYGYLKNAKDNLIMMEAHKLGDHIRREGTAASIREMVDKREKGLTEN